MKKNKYQVQVQIDDNYYLYYNAFSSKYLLLDDIKHKQFQSYCTKEVQEINTDFYDVLVNNQFLVPDDYDELSIVEYNILEEKMDTTMYNIVINVTLDCNLQCWYCYEHKIHGSNLKGDVLDGIRRNIILKYNQCRYQTLKISFFGGEPFLNFNGIKEILCFAKSFCEGKDIKLMADFTSNATLIKQNYIDYLKGFSCDFQITLDGNRDSHNKVKHLKGIDTYGSTLGNILRISDGIPQSRIFVRINYDKTTLEHIEEILEDIDFLDRKRHSIILRKIWQVKSSDIPHDLLIDAIQKIMDHGFFVDCYALSNDGVCFAERMNQVLINYDGKIFKCSTIDSFDDKNALGHMDTGTGQISMNKNKTSQILSLKGKGKCLHCALFPSCLGPCNKKVKSSQDKSCILDELGLSLKEFIMYNFKISLLYENIYSASI